MTRIHPPISRLALLWSSLLMALAGCAETFGAMAGGTVGAIPVIGRTLPDVVVSAIVNKDCSVVRLDAGKSYCAPEEKPPEPPMVCTRSLGTVDCWSNPDALGVPVREVAQGPRRLTPAQEAHRTRGWPGW